MVPTLTFFPLVCRQLWKNGSSAMVGLDDEVDSCVSVFGSFLKRYAFILLEVTCKSVNQPVFISVETGGKEGERIIAGRIQEGPAVCSSADSSQTPPESAAPAADAVANDSLREGEGHGGSVSGPGGGGNGPGGGDGGPGGEGPGTGGRSGGNEENLALDDRERLRRENLDKFVKMTVLISVSTGASLISFTREHATASMKSVLYLAVGVHICTFIFCFTGLLLRRKKLFEASIMTVLGLVGSGLGFLLTMGLIIPANFLWAVIVASSVLLSVASLLFLS